MERLHILWTTGDRASFYHMIAMYALNSLKMGWWDEVNLIIWGGSAELAGNDHQVQDELMELLRQGVSMEACRECCERYGVTEKLERMGISVRYMGEALSNYLKDGEKVLAL